MEMVNWGVLGTAGILGCTAKGMNLSEHCRLYAIAGRSKDKVDDFMAKYGFEKGYLSYDELLDDEEISAVYIPLPNNLHYEWVMTALNKGKHVLCEKPLAPDAATAKKMFETAKANNVYLMEAFAYQHSPYMEAVEKEISDGVIGNVRYIETAFITSDYDNSNIRMRRETLGGAAYDLGVYNTSFILRVMGKVPDNIKATASFSDNNIDLLTNGHIEYADGAKGTFTCGMVLETNADRRLDRFEIQGSKGTIRSGRFEYNLSGELTYEIVTFDECGNMNEPVMKSVKTPDNYMLEVEQLSMCILGESVPFVTEEFSVNNAEFLDGVLQAIGYYK